MELKAFESANAQEKTYKQKRLNEVQEKLLIDSFDTVKKVARGFHRTNRHIDVDDLESFLFEQLTLYVSKFNPEKGDGKTFVNAVLRDKARTYLKDHARYFNAFGARIPSTDEEIEGYEDSYVYVSYEDMEETVANEYDTATAVKQLFEIANETERAVMLAIMDGLSLGEIKRRFGFKHHEKIRRMLKRLSKKIGYNPLKNYA